MRGVAGRYSDLVEFKGSFLGGSERALVASAIDSAATLPGRCTTLLDVGSSDCKNTKKILDATSKGVAAFTLLTIDPDSEAIAQTPRDIVRTRHFPCRLENVDPGALPSADVVLFSHSLYYFASPIEALKHARRFVRPGGKIVVAMWGGHCDLRLIAGRLVFDSTPPSGTDIYEAATSFSNTRWHGTWQRLVNLDSWRHSESIAGAAGRTLAPETARTSGNIYDSVKRAIIDRGVIGLRQNVVFSIDAT